MLPAQIVNTSYSASGLQRTWLAGVFRDYRRSRQSSAAPDAVLASKNTRFDDYLKPDPILASSRTEIPADMSKPDPVLAYSRVAQKQEELSCSQLA